MAAIQDIDHTQDFREPWTVELDRVVGCLRDPESGRSWLSEAGSITARLRQHWPQVQVDVLWEGVRVPRWDESPCEALPPDALAWVREVRLHAHGIPLVSAKTVIPDWASAHAWRAVASLGSRPLAELLFSETGSDRSAMAFALLTRDGLQRPARRCIHTRQGASLWLTEVFDLLTQPTGSV
jgi:chorismate--pyruvate lyase